MEKNEYTEEYLEKQFEDLEQKDIAWDKKFDSRDNVNEAINNLTENDVVAQGVFGMYQLLEAKLRFFENERFGNLDFTRQGEKEKYPEYAQIKADILDYKLGSAYKLSPSGLMLRTQKLSRELDRMTINMKSDKEGSSPEPKPQTTEQFAKENEKAKDEIGVEKQIPEHVVNQSNISVAHAIKRYNAQYKPQDPNKAFENKLQSNKQIDIIEVELERERTRF
jgi:hypothetical protein